jgi:hypothetical protein
MRTDFRRATGASLEYLIQRLLQGVPDPDRLTESHHHETQRRIGTGAALALGVDRHMGQPV